MLQKLSHDIEIGGFGSKASGTMSDYGECMKQGVHATSSNSSNVALSGCRSGQLRSSRSLGLVELPLYPSVLAEFPTQLFRLLVGDDRLISPVEVQVTQSFQHGSSS
jgi:hypothetical protein